MHEVTTTDISAVTRQDAVVCSGQESDRGIARRAHFIGIGGAGMRSLASVLSDARWEIEGSDASEEACRELADRGWRVTSGHRRSNLSHDADCAVYSQAIAPDNPERIEARRRGLPIYSYAEMLGRIFNRHRTRVAVAGSHGKSTVSAMVASILDGARFDPSVVFGATAVAPVRAAGRRRGARDVAVVEACEYRENFAHLSPNVAVVTSVEPDHFDCYPSMRELTDAFERFVSRIDAGGYLLVGDACDVARRVGRSARCQVETFGLSPSADWTVRPQGMSRGRWQFGIAYQGRSIADIAMRVPGQHNMLNALAAAAIASRVGATPSGLTLGLNQFTGLRRRLEPLGIARGVAVWDDYAHHPTAITAVLQTLRGIYPKARISCIFQPHQASRTERLLDDFAASLQGADRVVVCDIVRARETPWISGDVTAKDLASRVREKGLAECQWHPWRENGTMLKLACCPGDVVVTLGAGNIWKVAHALANRI